MWALVQDGKVVAVYKTPRAVNIGGINHPRTIFNYWSAAQLKAIGLYSYNEVNASPDASYYNSGSSETVIDDSAGTVTKTFTNTLRLLADTLYTEDDKTKGNIPEDKDVGDVASIGLKNNEIDKIKNIAGSLLHTSDWYVTRKAEAGTAIPSAVATYRTAVRANTAIMEAKVKAISDTTNQTNMDAFIALKTNTYHANGDIITLGHLNNWPIIPEILE